MTNILSKIPLIILISILLISLSPIGYNTSQNIEVQGDRESLAIENISSKVSQSEFATSSHSKDTETEENFKNYFQSSLDTYLDIDQNKEIYIDDTLNSMISKTPEEMLWTKSERILISFDYISQEAEDRLSSFDFDYLSSIHVGIASIPLGYVNQIANIPGLTGIYLDTYQKFISDDWKQEPKTDLETFTYPSEAATGARNLQSIGYNGTGITIAVVDTGIDRFHPDLDDFDNDPVTNDPKVILEKSFVDNNNDGTPDEGTEDIYGHGTHVSGIAAGNGLLVGMAPGASLINAKVLDRYGGGTFEWIMRGVDWAAANGADIISMSLGGFFGDVQPLLNAAVEAASDSGIMLVISAGNAGPQEGTTASPGMSSSAFTVGASDYYNDVVFFSSRGPSITGVVDPDIIAPGHEILSTLPGGTYGVASGTSMSAPAVSGGLALLMEAFPGAESDRLRSVVMQSAKDLDRHVFSQGAGFLDLKAAYDLMDTGSETNYGFPAFPAHAPLKLSPGETFEFQLDLFLHETFTPTISFSGYTSEIQLTSIENGNSGWIKSRLKVIMPNSAKTGSIDVYDGATLKFSIPFNLAIGEVANDGGTGTDAGETFSGSLDLIESSKSFGTLTMTDLMDLYNFTTVKGNSYSLVLDDLNSDLDLFIQDENGSVFDISAAGGTNLENITFTAFSSGEYMARIVPWGSINPLMEYSIMFSDYGNIGGEVGTGVGQILGNYQSTLIDEDENGLSESLVISFDVEIYEEAPFDFLFTLSQNRSDYATNLYYAYDGWISEYLEPGTHTIELSIDTGGLGSSGYDGTYVLNDLLFGDTRTYTIIDYIYSVYETPSYNHDDFEPWDLYLDNFSINSIDTIGTSVEDTLEVSFTFYFPDTGYYYFDVPFLDAQQSYVLDWVDTSILIDEIGLHTITVQPNTQRLEIGQDIWLAGIFGSDLPNLIPLYEKIEQSVIDELESIDTDFTLTELPFDSDGNGYDDSLRLIVEFTLIEEDYVNFAVGYAFSTVNETALSLSRYNYTMAPSGVSTIIIDYPISIFTSKGNHGPFLFPSINFYSNNRYEEFYYLTAAYTPDDFEDPSMKIGNLYIQENDDITVGGYKITLTTHTAIADEYQLTLRIEGYESLNGYYWDYLNVEENFEGTQNTSFIISGRDLYLSKFIGSLEIVTIEIELLDSDYRYNLVDYSYHNGLIKNINYIDYVEYADTLFHGYSLVPYNTDADSLYEGLNISVQIEIRTAGTYNIEIYGYTNNYYGYYEDDHAILNAEGNYTIVFLIPASSVVRSLTGQVVFQISISNYYNNWRDWLSFSSDLEPEDYDYVLPVKFTQFLGDEGVDTSGNGLFNQIAIHVELNVTTTDYYSLDMDGAIIFEFPQSTWIFGLGRLGNVDLGELSIGLHEVTIVVDTYQFREYIEWASEDEGMPETIKIQIQELFIYDSLGGFKLGADFFETTSYTPDQLDLSPLIEIVDWMVEFIDTDSDSIADIMKLTFVLNVTAYILLGLNINIQIYNPDTDNYHYSGELREFLISPGVHNYDILVDLDDFFQGDIPSYFDVFVWMYLYDYETERHLGDISFDMTLQEDDLFVTNETNTTTSTSITSSSTVSTTITERGTITTTSDTPAFTFGYVLAIVSLLGISISVRRRK